MKPDPLLKILFGIFFILYAFLPLIIVPSFAYYFGNWYLAFGILFSYAGSFCSLSRPTRRIFIFFGLFCIGFWIFKGFSIHQYLTFYFFCTIWGYFTCAFAEEFDQERKKGTLDNDEERLRHFEENREEIDAKLLEFLKENPGKKLSYDDVDKIVRSTKK